jgi:DtxR family Mn-dependent transcriptional regulator
VARVLEESFEAPGGLVTSTRWSAGQNRGSKKQWDWPNGWAPLQLLATEGLRRYGHVEQARRIAERWLTDVLGLDWAQADVEASKLEHAFSLEVADRLSRLMENPKTCPHGNPIPGNSAEPMQAGPRLDSIPAGAETVVERVVEHAEVDSKLLRYFWRHGILPGVRLTVTDKVPGAGTVVVRRDGEEISLGMNAANKIQVSEVT